MLSILFLGLCSLSFALPESKVKESAWESLGCTSEGLLSPENSPDLWPSQMGRIIKLAQMDHPLAKSACTGPQEHSSKPTTFHLLWECLDDDTFCLLPTLNVHGLNSLSAYHPDSTINVWSNTLDAEFLTARVRGDVKLRRYDASLFEGTPEAAQLAYEAIPKFFDSVVESHSHFSDLFRLAVLYKYGGVWTDFDSVWVDSVESVSDEDSWMPITNRKLSGWHLINDESFIEGGIMKFPAQDPFVERALATFPEYTQEIAECWACVGPQHLTNTYINMQFRGEDLPATVPSATLYGGSKYREQLPSMHNSLELDVVRPNSVAFHLFTSSGEFNIEKNSLIDFLFRSAGVDATGAKEVALGKLSQRRRIQEAEGSDTYSTEEPVETVQADMKMEGVDWSSVEDNVPRLLEECSEQVPADCIAARQGSVIITLEGSEEDVDASVIEIERDGLDLPSFEPMTGYLYVGEDSLTRSEWDDLEARVARLEADQTTIQENVDDVDEGLVSLSTCFANYNQDENEGTRRRMSEIEQLRADNAALLELIESM